MAGTAAAAGSALDELRGQIRGEVVSESDSGYAEARQIWNGMIERRPALVVRCTGSADVIAAVNFAREAGMPVSVRSGGHNVAGTALCDGGVVVDLTRMRNVFVDPERRTVRAAGGARLGDVDHETQAFALATPFGVVSKTGIAGLTLNGGMGFLTRKYGLSCDNLVGADVVTADGKLVRADSERNPELLWALRGGGGSFGVATSLEYRLHDVGPIIFMAIAFYPAEAGKEGLQAWSETMRDAPDELMSVAIYWNAPAEEPFPPEWHGKPVFILVGAWSGPLEQAEEAVRPLRELAEPIADLSSPMPYVIAQSLFDAEYPDGQRHYWKSAYLSRRRRRGRGALRPGRGGPAVAAELDRHLGAGRSVPATQPEGGSAFAQRDAPFLFGLEANWEEADRDADNLTWARDLFDGAKAHSPGGS